MNGKVLGLTGYELEVYKGLLKTGLATAKEVAKQCSVPLTAIYPNLTTLHEKGLIKKFDGTQAKYQALPPKIAFDAAVKSNMDTMKKAKELLIKEYDSVESVSVQTSPVQVSLGTEASMSWWHDVAQQAKKSIYVVGWRFGKRSIFNLLRSIKELHKRNVEMKFIVIAKNERTLLLYRECKKLGISVKYLDMDNFSLILTDRSKCKITLKNRELEERVNIQVNDKYLARGLSGYFDSLWKRAKDL